MNKNVDLILAIKMKLRSSVQKLIGIPLCNKQIAVISLGNFFRIEYAVSFSCYHSSNCLGHRAIHNTMTPFRVEGYLNSLFNLLSLAFDLFLLKIQDLVDTSYRDLADY